MDKANVKEILERWTIGTAGRSYMSGLEDRPVMARGEGSYHYDTDGNAYLDFGSGQMGAALGHNHPRIVEAVKRSLETLIHSSNTFLNQPRLELHEKLGQLLVPPLEKSLFLVTGSDSIEAAVDLARKATGGTEILALQTSLHGSSSFVSRSLSFNWSRRHHALNAPSTSAILSPYCYRCPVASRFPGCDYLCLKTGMSLADANFAGPPAAVILEPIMSAGGVIEPPPGYLEALRKECDERGMLLIFDEAQTGLGKTGKLWAFEHSGVVPDIMAVSKHFGGGLPIGAVCTTAEVAERAVSNGYFATRSHATDPVLCTAGAASLDVVTEERLPERAARIEQRIKSAFETMANDVELIGDIRGSGVLLGIELVTERETRAPANDAARRVLDFCQDAGLLLQLRGTGTSRNVLRLVPPMTSSDEDIDRGIGILNDALRAAL